MEKRLNEQQIKSICAILADTKNGLTKTEIKTYLINCKIPIVDDEKIVVENGLSYQVGTNKKNFLYSCFAQRVNKTQSYNCIYEFIQTALNPINYTKTENREKYKWLSEELNKVLILLGLQVKDDGEIIVVGKANTLREVDKRVNDLKKKLYERSIHSEVVRYCESDYLRKDYFDAVFEAAKGLAERVRNITGLKTDGGTLFNTAFSTKDPYLFFNKLSNESEESEFKGLKDLLCAIFHLARNPEAHTPKINWKVDQTKALDILTLISFAHKYLDECHKMPNK